MDYIWNGLAMIVELTNIILCYTQILQKELCDKKKRIVIVYVGVVISSVIYTFYSGENWSIFIGIIYYLLSILIIVDGKKLSNILLYPYAFTLQSVVCIMCSYIVATVMGIPHSVLADKVEMVAPINGTFLLILGVIYFSFKHKNNKRNNLVFTKSVYVAIMIGSVSFLFILSAVQSIGKRYNVPYNQTNLLGFLLSCVCMIFFYLFIWLSTTIHKKNVYQREKDMMSIHMNEQERYIKLVVEKDMDMRKFRHDVKEHMKLVHKYLEDLEYDEAKEYIKKMYEVFSESQIKRYTGVNAIDAIISEKKRYMEENGIVFNWEGSACEIPMRLEIFDMCTMFTNIISNAIEACEELEASDKCIDMSVSLYEDKIYIRESNKFLNIINFDENNNPISTKDDKTRHGYGSRNIRAVVEKYNGEIQYDTHNGMFTIEIVL